jgi:HipA-like protein
MKSSAPISKILVFSDEPRTRVFVGELLRHSKGYSFEYDEDYMARASATPLGPDLPFSLKPIASKTLFESLADLVPSRANPAYEDYCRRVGIDPKEADPMILLAYLGRGPSTFVFEPAPDDEVPSGKQITTFRDGLGLSQRQFAKFLDLPFPTLQAVEKETARAHTARRLIQAFLDNPQALTRLLSKRGLFLGQKQRETVEHYLQDQAEARASSALNIEKQYQELGHIDLFHVPIGIENRWTQRQLLDAAEKATCFNTGWPIGVVLHVAEKRPLFKHDGIEMKLETFSGGYDEWTLRRDGSFHFFRIFGEDRETRPKRSDVLYFDIRIWRIAEALLHCLKLYAALSLSPATVIQFNITHGGLKGRRLASSTPLRLEPFPPKIASEEISPWEGRFSLEELSNNSNFYVSEICKELFVLFDGWKIPKEPLEQIIADFSKSRM